MNEASAGNHDASDRQYSHYNPVEVVVRPNEVVGAVFLGVIALVLLLAFLRSQRKLVRLQERVARLEAEAGNL